MNSRRDRSGIAGLFFPRLPIHFSLPPPADHRLPLAIVLAHTRPPRSVGGPPEALDALTVPNATMEHQPITADRGRAVAGADLLLPNHWRPIGRPFLQQTSFAGGSIGTRPEELRPVFADDRQRARNV